VSGDCRLAKLSHGSPRRGFGASSSSVAPETDLHLIVFSTSSRRCFSEADGLRKAGLPEGRSLGLCEFF
jgi:hypothetical protein